MKSAYVTLLNDDDHPGFFILFNFSIFIKKTHTKHDIVLLYTLDVPHYKLELLSNFLYTSYSCRTCSILKKEILNAVYLIFLRNFKYLI